MIVINYLMSTKPTVSTINRHLIFFSKVCLTKSFVIVDNYTKLDQV